MRQILEVGEFEFFDTLYQRYADPLPLINQMAAAGQLSWFIRNLTNAKVTEENEKLMWDTWLHKVWDQEWKDYKQEVMNRARTYFENEFIRTHPQETVKIVAKSRAIIDQFEKPTESN